MQIEGRLPITSTSFQPIGAKILVEGMKNGPRSNVNMPIEKTYATLYLLAIAVFALSVTICEEFTIEMCVTLALTFRIGQSEI